MTAGPQRPQMNWVATSPLLVAIVGGTALLAVRLGAMGVPSRPSPRMRGWTSRALMFATPIPRRQRFASAADRLALRVTARLRGGADAHHKSTTPPPKRDRKEHH